MNAEAVKRGLLGRVVLLLVLAGVTQLLLASPAHCARRPPDDVIRLHVVAHADAPQDQRIKEEVRRRLVRLTAELLRGARDGATARRVLRGELARIERAAAEAAGRYPAQVRLTVVRFPAARYGDSHLPAGPYWALRVVLGRGEGENWWCVLFPSLCILAPADVQQVGAPPGRPVRFALGEMFARLDRRRYLTALRAAFNPAGHFHRLPSHPNE